MSISQKLRQAAAARKRRSSSPHPPSGHDAPSLKQTALCLSLRRAADMAEYATLKVPELKKLLAEKGLPQAGNKADLIARLQENDKKADGAEEPGMC
ncbi:hypothetical protein G7046_g9546 [Stylonectria norvegica]|nr:hypothetical protein G7046_g9546 [Stylonectria norvegica]